MDDKRTRPIVRHRASAGPPAGPDEAARAKSLWTAAVLYVPQSTAARVLIAIVAGSTMLLAGLLAYRYSPRGQAYSAAPRSLEFTVADALAALDGGATVKAQRMAARLAELDSLPPADAGGVLFIFGVVAANEAQRLSGADQRRYFRLAATYLQESRTKGFPAWHEAQARLLLGKSLLLSGQIAASRSVLEEALTADPAAGAELHLLLATAYKADPQPQYDRALLHIGMYLDEPSLAREERGLGLLQRAQMLLRLKLDGECRKVLAEIDPASEAAVESLLVEGELLMREAAALLADEQASSDEQPPPDERRTRANEKFQAAIDVLRRAQNRGSQRERITPHSMYLVGRCLLEMEDLPAALDQFHRTRLTYDESSEGMAAALEEAEIARRLGQSKSIDAYLTLLKAAGPGDAYYNPLLPLETLRARLLAAYQAFVEAGDYQSATDLAAALHPLFPRENSITLVAQGQSGWADSLESQAAMHSGKELNQLIEEARRHRRAAGAAYGVLSTLRFATEHYPDDVWKSAENYLRAQDYPRAESMLEEYLKYELRRRRARVLLNLGETQLALGKPAQALITLQECIDDYPRDPASCRARWIAARAQMEHGDLARAKRLLLANLDADLLTPESVEWRDSLFSLGALLHDEGQMVEAQGRQWRAEAAASSSSEKQNQADAALERARTLYEEAAKRLEEAAARYPDVPQVVESRYVTGESQRALARLVREKLDGAKIETTRPDHSRELHGLLTAAVAHYEQVHEILAWRERSQLTALEQAILRNCYFARGAAYFELGRFEDAIAAYSAATSRYHNEPEVLDAFFQLAQCYRRLHKPDESRGVIEQAKVVLSRIRDDASFAQTTIHSRQEWVRVLDWMEQL